MFLENTVNHKEQFGWIEVICGSMFSGKTEELIRRLKRAQFARQKVEIFKPAIDVRYDEDMVVSHDENQIRSTPVPAAANIPILADGVYNTYSLSCLKWLSFNFCPAFLHSISITGFFFPKVTAMSTLVPLLPFISATYS